MAVQPLRADLSPIYEEDLAAWATATAERLRARDFEGLDLENVAEEIESLARQDDRELSRRLVVLVVHLLRWHYQFELRGNSWASTILIQRNEIEQLLKKSPSLQAKIGPQLEEVFHDAREEAILHAGLVLDRIPPGVLYSEEQILADWLPEDQA